MKVFIDASGFLAMLMSGDNYHARAASYYKALVDDNHTLYTTDYVLDEVLTRLRYDAGSRVASEFLHTIRQLVTQGEIVVMWINEARWIRAAEIFEQYSDVRLSFTDCVSFAYLEERPVDEVFGFDAHFEMMGHVLRPK